MCKMTIVNETKDDYDKLVFVEFLEFVARLADCKFPGNVTPLETKLEMFMDLIFPKILNKQPVPSKGEVEEESESDLDY